MILQKKIMHYRTLLVMMTVVLMVVTVVVWFEVMTIMIVVACNTSILDMNAIVGFSLCLL